MYRSQLCFKDVLWVAAVHTIKTSWKQKTIFDDSLGENPWGKPKKTKNLEKTKKKKQNFSENVWSDAHVWFFLVLPSFFVFFCLDLEKTKKTQGFLFFG